jgi:hypothetical protein
MGLAWVSKGVNSDVPHETCHLGVNGVYDGVWYIYIMLYDGSMVYDGI